MGKDIRNKSLPKKMLKYHDKCELCGNNSNLQVHHKIPITLQKCMPKGVNLDTTDNLIVVCQKCHALLSPQSILTSIGVNYAMHGLYNDKVKTFYENLNEYNGHLDVCTVLDEFDLIFIKG